MEHAVQNRPATVSPSIFGVYVLYCPALFVMSESRNFPLPLFCVARAHIVFSRNWPIVIRCCHAPLTCNVRYFCVSYCWMMTFWCQAREPAVPCGEKTVDRERHHGIHGTGLRKHWQLNYTEKIYGVGSLQFCTLKDLHDHSCSIFIFHL